MIPLCRTEVPVLAMDTPLLSQFPANASGKARGDDPKTCASLTLSVGDQNGVSGFWLHPSPELAIANIWELNQQMKKSVFCDT